MGLRGAGQEVVHGPIVEGLRAAYERHDDIVESQMFWQNTWRIDIVKDFKHQAKTTWPGYCTHGH